MKKTPFWGKQHIIESTDRKKVSQRENLSLFSLDILQSVPYFSNWQVLLEREVA